MKAKVLAILISALLVATVSGCGNKDDNNSSTNSTTNNVNSTVDDSSKSNDDSSKPDDDNSKTNDNSNIGPLTQSAYIDILSNGNFYMDMSISASNTVSDMVAASNGNKLFMKMDISGQSVKIYYIDDKAYMVDDTNKQVLYYNSDENVNDLIDDITSDIDTDSMKLIESGKATFDGKECDFEKYDEKSVNLIEILYFYNGEVVGIVAENADGVVTSTTKITLTNNIPEGTFDLPSENEYTYTDYSDMMS